MFGHARIWNIPSKKGRSLKLGGILHVHGPLNQGRFPIPFVFLLVPIAGKGGFAGRIDRWARRRINLGHIILVLILIRIRSAQDRGFGHAGYVGGLIVTFVVIILVGKRSHFRGWRQTAGHLWPGGRVDLGHLVVFGLDPGQENLLGNDLFFLILAYVWALGAHHRRGGHGRPSAGQHLGGGGFLVGARHGGAVFQLVSLNNFVDLGQFSQCQRGRFDLAGVVGSGRFRGLLRLSTAQARKSLSGADQVGIVRKRLFVDLGGLIFVIQTLDQELGRGQHQLSPLVRICGGLGPGQVQGDHLLPFEVVFCPGAQLLVCHRLGRVQLDGPAVAVVGRCRIAFVFVQQSRAHADRGGRSGVQGGGEVLANRHDLGYEAVFVAQAK